MRKSSSVFKETGAIDALSARHYHRFPGVIFASARGVWVRDTEGREYLDCLAAYSAVNIGHNHPRIERAIAEDLPMLSHSLYARTELAYKKALCQFSGMEAVLSMNSGAEAFETALKLVRKWGYTRKGVPADAAEVIVAQGNFHGRTLAAISASSYEPYKAGFGPLVPGFVWAPYGDIEATIPLINARTVAVIVEPIQGEGGINVPPPGYLKALQKLCVASGVLFVLDEVQTGFGRTGQNFAYQHEDAKPDILLVGKSLGGGRYPVSAVLASREIMDTFEPGDHGSTWGENAFACRIGEEAINILRDEGLTENARILGEYFLRKLQDMNLPIVSEVRGKGLLVGLELIPGAGDADIWCEKLLHAPGAVGMICKGTRKNVLRLSPPLCINKDEIDLALDLIKRMLH